MKVPVRLAALVAGGLAIAAPSVAAQSHDMPHASGEEGVCPAAPALSTPLETVRFLADDALEGRFSGSRGEVCAAGFIVAAFEALGLEPAGDEGFLQTLSLGSAVNPHAPAGSGRNLVARLPGADPALAGTAVVLGAHYDHLGRGQFGSTGTVGEIHNGADDNASGVAAMLEAARLIAEGPRPARTIVFVAFTGEELGLIGSSYYAKNPAVPLDRTVAMVNLDMVGRLESGSMIVNGTGTAPEWDELLTRANEGPGIPLVYEPGGFGPSDHTSFYAQEIPVLHFFTNVHGDYHAETDDWDRIDAPGLDRVARLTANVVRRLGERPDRLTVIPGVDQRDAAASEGARPWLGTIPDFTPVEFGVLLSGVSDGSPAAAAGMVAGDVLIGLGEFEIADLQALQDALTSHAPGDEVELRYLREEAEHRATITLMSRTERP